MAARIDTKPVHTFMRKNNGILSNKQMARALGVSDTYICAQRKVLGLKAPRVCSQKPQAAGVAARNTMINEAMAGEFSLGWLRKAWTASTTKASKTKAGRKTKPEQTTADTLSHNLLRKAWTGEGASHV